MTTADAWKELHAATPPGWFVGAPIYHDARHKWMLYAYDPNERAVAGVRPREWKAVADSEEAVLLEMARCLRLIREGQVPKERRARPRR